MLNDADGGSDCGALLLGVGAVMAQDQVKETQAR